VPERALLILASSSPRRLALLRQVGVIPDRIEAPQIDETPLARELPRAYVLRLAEAKANDVARRSDADDAFVLAADTVVACGRRILGKANDLAAAERCLRLLSGRRHRVYTAVAVAAPGGRSAVRVAQTVVRFKRLHERAIASYLACDEWRGKAGGYAIQGRAEAFILSINGSYSNVVGLPLATTLDLLAGLGWRSEP
jgi:septum formation protein